MFEVAPSPARHPARSTSRALAAAAPFAAAALVATAGCVSSIDAPPPGPPPPACEQTPRMGDVPPGAEMELESPTTDALLVPCVVGTWVIAPAPCACPPEGAADYTVECAAPDCAETLALVLRQTGQAFRASIRFSGQTRTLSAIGGQASCGTWHYYDDGELELAFEGNKKYTPTECAGGELVQKGEAPMEKATPALRSSISWAVATGQWTEAPYLP